MSFLQPQITQEHFQVIENTAEGTIVTPEASVEYPGNEDAAKAFGVALDDITTVYGFGARLSAPGYMDCTDWVVFNTEKDAAEYLLETYGDGLDADEIESLEEVRT